MDPGYQSIAKDAFVESEARSERLMRLLAEPNDLVSLVLRGHLVLEELLFAACAAYCQDPEHLKSVKLRFPQLISLLRALEKIPAAPPHYWEALVELNSLRNALAHRLEPTDIDVRIQRLVQIANLPTVEGQDTDASLRKQLERTLYFLIGGFEVVAVFHKALEILVAHRALNGNDSAA